MVGGSQTSTHRTRRRCETEPRILRSLSAEKRNLPRCAKLHAKFGTSKRNNGRKDEKAKHTRKRFGKDGTIPCPPHGHGVIGDGTKDVRTISLLSAVRPNSVFFSCEVLVRIQRPRKQCSEREEENTHILKRTQYIAPQHFVRPTATRLSSQFVPVRSRSTPIESSFIIGVTEKRRCASSWTSS